MKAKFPIPIVAFLLLCISCSNPTKSNQQEDMSEEQQERQMKEPIPTSIPLAGMNDTLYVNYAVNPKIANIGLFWKDDSGNILGNIRNLKEYIERKNQQLVFSMNGGMYDPGNIPKGLFIQDFKQVVKIDKINKPNGTGRYYLHPNGIFYITADNTPHICVRDEFVPSKDVKMANQSGPMLLIKRSVHPRIAERKRATIVNGVGVKGDTVVFVKSKKEMTMLEFANYFKSLGCSDALYLDGAISAAYLPEKGYVQMGGDFGVIIGIAIP